MKRLVLTALILCSLALSLGAQSGEDRYEPNDSSSSARPLNPGRYDLSFSAGDEDWFSFRLSSPRLIHVYTEGGLDTGLSLYKSDADMTEISSDDDGGEDYNARIALFLGEPGLYYIRAKPYDDETEGAYSLVLEAAELKADALEPNNSQAQARPLALSRLPLDLTLDLADDADWFRLDLAAFPYREKEILSFYTSGDLDTLLTLCDAGGEELDSDDDGGEDYNARLGFLPERGAAYYLRIQGYEGARGEYRLHAETEIGEFDQYEPNGFRSQATEISLGQILSGNVLGDYDSVDWFRFSIDQPGTYAIGTTGGLDTFISLRDAEGGELDSDDDGGGRTNALIEIYLEPGTYYAKTTQLGNDGYGEYSFFVRRL
ncbi:MAG: PPC domain-containing protein [Treponema sp.]|jgi:hypothetical protein|nr:PPC domain-containing protein [Treponema sp.]